MSKRISKIIPSFLVDKASCTRQFESELSLHSLASLFPIKEGSTFLTKPLFPQGREDVTALRCSEPLCSKVGGPSKVSPYYAGWDRLDTMLFMPNLKTYFIWIRGKQRQVKHVIIFSLTLLQIQRSLQRFWNHQTAGNTYWHKVLETYCVYQPLSCLPKLPLCRLSAIRCIVPRS